MVMNNTWKQRAVVLLVFICIMVNICAIIFSRTQTNFTEPEIGSNKNVQSSRIQQLKQTCDRKDFLKENIYHGKPNTLYYYSEHYKFAFCKVLKSGSTFWTQVFEILNEDPKKGEHIFKQSRKMVHRQADSYTSTSINDIQGLPTVLVSRDPYSRLYSAYTDKVFLMMYPWLSCVIRNALNGTKVHKDCPTNVTFQEFLEYVILSVKRGETLNGHYAPIVSLCLPCQLNAKYLVKQESFAADTVSVLEDIGVEQNKLDVITAALHENRIENTISSIVKTAYGRLRKIMKASKMAETIWKSFQIQGYIPDAVDLPETRFTSEDDYKNSKYFIYVVMETIETHKMTSQESKRQRQKALVNAYRHIDQSLIDDLKKIYEIDIAMFGYNESPPDTY